MNAALVNRMPFRPRTGKIENISYILDNRWSGNPIHAANNEHFGVPHSLLQQSSLKTEQGEAVQSGQQNPRQFPEHGLWVSKTSTVNRQKPKTQSIDGIVRNEAVQVLSNLLKTLLPYGTTLDSVIIEDSAKKEIKAQQEGLKQPALPKSHKGFFSYFDNPHYTPIKSSFAIAQYFVSAYNSLTQSFKNLFEEYISPNYVTLPFKARSRLRKRRNIYRLVAVEYPTTKKTYATNALHSIVIDTYQKVAQYLKSKTVFQQYTQQFAVPINEHQKHYLMSQTRAYNRAAILSMNNFQEPRQNVKEVKSFYLYLSASSKLIAAAKPSIVPTSPFAANQDTYSTNIIEKKFEQQKDLSQPTPFTSLLHSHKAPESIDRLLVGETSIPRHVSIDAKMFFLAMQNTHITPIYSFNKSIKPYITEKGELVEGAYRISVQITKEVQQRASGLDVLSIAYSELSRSGPRSGIVEQTYTDSTTGQTTRGRKIVLFDYPNHHIEVLYGDSPQTTSFLSFKRHDDTPLAQKAQSMHFMDIIIKKDNVYIKELESRFETPKNGKVIEHYHSSPIQMNMVYKKAA